MSKKELTMWIIPDKIKQVEPWNLVQILRLFDAVSAGQVTKLVSTNLLRRLNELGVNVATWRSGFIPVSLLRMYLPEFVFLGLVFHRGRGEWILTNAGEALMGVEDPLEVLRCQLLRLQYPSVYTRALGQNCAEKLRIRPFVFLLRLLEDPRVGALNAQEAAVAVVYGRTQRDFEACVRKILLVRRSEKDAVDAVKAVVDNVADVSTPKRYVKEGVPEESVLETGCNFAVRYAASALQLLSAAQLIRRTEKKRWEINDAEDAQRAMNQYMGDPDTEMDKPEHGEKETWQLQFGRYNREADPRSAFCPHQSSGLDAVISTEYIAEVQEKLDKFDEKLFCWRAMYQYDLPLQKVKDVCSIIRQSRSRIERDTQMHMQLTGNGT